MEDKTLYGIKGTRNAFMAAWLMTHPDLQKIYGKHPNYAFAQFTPEMEAGYQEFLKANDDLQSHKVTAKELGNSLEEFFNSYGPHEKALISELERKHRTLQQSITKFFFKWIEHCASEEYRTDRRNEASQTIARRVLDAWNSLGERENAGVPPSYWLPMV